MPDSPAPIRGYFYSSHLTKRCAAFKGCVACGLCEHFDRHSLRCQTCESRKLDKRARGCSCTNGQKGFYLTMQEKMRRPMFDLDGIAMPGLNEDITTNPYFQDLNKAISEEFTGVGVNTAVHTVEPTNETVGQAIGI